MPYTNAAAIMRTWRNVTAIYVGKEGVLPTSLRSRDAAYYVLRRCMFRRIDPSVSYLPRPLPTDRQRPANLIDFFSSSKLKPQPIIAEIIPLRKMFACQ